MKITYTCEICGHTSENREEIEGCERKGYNPLLTEEQQVLWNYTGHPEHPEDFAPVTIIMPGERGRDYRCERQTHEPIYSVMITDPGVKLLEGIERMRGTFITVHESRLFKPVPGTENICVPVNREAMLKEIKGRQELFEYTLRRLSDQKE